MKLKQITSIGLAVLLVFHCATTETYAEIAASSADYKLDFGSVVYDSDRKTSTDYKLDDHIIDVAKTGSSNDYKLTSTLYVPTPVSVCGNGTIESGEQCEGSNYNGSTCATYGFNSGNLSCSGTCQIVSTACFNSTPTPPNNGGGGGSSGYVPPVCGNGILEAGEQCEGNDFRNKTCATYNFDSGNLSCNSTCKIETSNCIKNPVPTTPICGNNIIESGEVCDGSALSNKTCTDYGFDNGTLACNNNCKNIETKGCFNEVVPEPKPEDSLPPDCRQHYNTTTKKVTMCHQSQDTIFVGLASFDSHIAQGDYCGPCKKEDEIKYEQKEEEKIEEVMEDIIPETIVTETKKESAPTTIEEPKKEIQEYVLNTIDNTPVVSNYEQLDKLEPNITYNVMIYDDKHNLITTDILNTDSKGNYVFEPSDNIPTGNFEIQIIDENKNVVIIHKIGVFDDSLGRLDITRFAVYDNFQSKLNKAVFLGDVKKVDANMYISGYADPFDKIVIYFTSEVFYVETRADANGYFQAKIPRGLDHGVHAATIYKEKENHITNIRSDNLKFYFNLVPPNYEISMCLINLNIYLIMFLSLVLIVIIETILISYYNRKVKKNNQNKKTKLLNIKPKTNSKIKIKTL